MKKTKEKLMDPCSDPQHFLDDNGDIPEEIPGPARNFAIFLSSIVGWVLSHRDDRYELTNVPCRRSPGHRRCSGTIIAWIEDDDEGITWTCPVCDDGGTISGWKNTYWDRRDG